MGNLFRCKGLAGDQESQQICRQRTVHRFRHRPLSAAGGTIRAHTRFAGAASGQRRKAEFSKQLAGQAINRMERFSDTPSFWAVMAAEKK